MNEVEAGKELIIREILRPIGFDQHPLEDDSHDGLMYDGEISLMCGITYQYDKPEIPGLPLQVYSRCKLQIWITYQTCYNPCIEIEISLKASSLPYGYWVFELVDPNAIREAQKILRRLYHGPTEGQNTEQDVVPI